MIKNKVEKQMTENPTSETIEIKQLPVTANTLDNQVYLNNLYADSMEYHYLLPCA